MSVRPHGMTRYKNGPDQHGNPGRGCRCAACRAAVNAYERNRVRQIAYGRWQARTDAAGTRRRVQALMRAGWALGALGARAGRTRKAMAKILTYRNVSPATAAWVRELYDDLWDRPPPEATRLEKGAATKARNYAREHGFAPVGAWDDDPGSPHFIDDPDAVPVPGCVRGDRPEWGALTENAVELAGQGEHVEMIAQRLGVKAKTVERTLQRAGQQPWRERSAA